MRGEFGCTIDKTTFGESENCGVFNLLFSISCKRSQQEYTFSCFYKPYLRKETRINNHLKKKSHHCQFHNAKPLTMSCGLKNLITLILTPIASRVNRPSQATNTAQAATIEGRDSIEFVSTTKHIDQISKKQHILALNLNHSLPMSYGFFTSDHGQNRFHRTRDHYPFRGPITALVRAELIDEVIEVRKGCH